MFSNKPGWLHLSERLKLCVYSLRVPLQGRKSPFPGLKKNLRNCTNLVKCRQCLLTCCKSSYPFLLQSLCHFIHSVRFVVKFIYIPATFGCLVLNLDPKSLTGSMKWSSRTYWGGQLADCCLTSAVQLSQCSFSSGGHRFAFVLKSFQAQLLWVLLCLDFCSLHMLRVWLLSRIHYCGNHWSLKISCKKSNYVINNEKRCWLI